MSRHSSKRLLVATLVVLTLNVSGALAQTRSGAVTTVADLSQSLENTARLVSPSVVQIFTTSYLAHEGLVPSSADLVTTQRSSGSGVIVDPNGYIVTNAHVVRGAQRLRLELPIPATGHSVLATSRRSVSGRILGIDLETDLAVIKVEQQNLPALAFADSDDVKAGQMVLAFGSPLGFNNSVSLGVVSSVARQLEPESPMIYLQTDASINPGSSGGPLVDVRGRLVGINTLIFSQAGGDEGIGFAAPSNIVRTVFEQIKNTGRVRRGDIGILPQTVTPVLASGLKLERGHGVVLADVMPGGAAARAGLRPGDLVLALEGKPMENGRQLQVNLYRRLVGEIVELKILRRGEVWDVGVTMGERQDSAPGLPALTDPRENIVPRLGILGVTMDPQIAAMLPARRVQSGVVVVSMVDGALDVREGGLAPGDIIYAVNRKPVAGLEELRSEMDPLKPGDAVVLQLERRGVLLYLAFTVGG